MGLYPPQFTFNEDEYLGLDRASEERFYYHAGDVFKMPPSSIDHSQITGNVGASLHGQLKGRPCRVRSVRTLVRSGPLPKDYQSTAGLYSYPDVAVVCGEVECLDERGDVVLNPKVVVEVLQPETELFDRGIKFDHYTKYTPSLTDYILIATDIPSVEHYRREDEGRWLWHHTTGLEATFRIASIGCTLALTDVYDRVAFPPES